MAVRLWQVAVELLRLKVLKADAMGAVALVRRSAIAADPGP